MDKDKNGVVIKVIKGVGFAVALFIIIPAITAIIVSVSLFPCLETSNDWIGFLGSYLGSILGGIITHLVMQKTLVSSKELQRRDERRQLCNHIASLSSDFCIELMAYRSKWKMLYNQAQGQSIDAEKKIELGATTEKPRRIMFEMEILLCDVEAANDCLEYMKYLLSDAELTKKSLQETEELLNRFRQKIRTLISSYLKERH